ncbi:PP2C family protein-serine/threonine phosphatase [Thiohalorhabdus sp.]|uniref:PP2C family protein-serine/threonine phosphatase n=1 Tax=Thiohalorhabdus sp. TaxID=3094134 RepID=UPI002FC27974
MNAWQSVAISEIGQRGTNEDDFLEAPDLGLWAVADGMGGHAHGEIASRTALSALKSAMLEGQDLAAAATAANRTTWEAARQRGSDMGTTLVALRLHADAGEVAWLGDSRAYRWDGATLSQVTSDHTVVQEWVAQGRIRPEEARHHPYGHVLTRALGLDRDEQAEAVWLPLEGGERFLLCSDGLTDTLTDAEIARVLGHSPDADAPGALYQAAAAAGNPHQDNLTAVVIYPA